MQAKRTFQEFNESSKKEESQNKRAKLPYSLSPENFQEMIQNRYPECSKISLTLHIGDVDTPESHCELNLKMVPKNFMKNIKKNIPYAMIEQDFCMTNDVVHGPLIAVLKDANNNDIDTISAEQVRFFHNPSAEGIFMYDYTYQLQSIIYGRAIPGDYGA